MMTRSLLDAVLERGYWISQILLFITAALAAIIAFVQAQTFKRFELLKFLENRHVKGARRIIYRQMQQPNNKNVWRDDPDVEAAAGTVCSTFDIVGYLARGWNRRFFKRHWAYPICWTYEILEEYRNSRVAPFRGFDSLYDDAKPFDIRPKTDPKQKVKSN